MTHDVLVIGLGAMGASTAYQLASRGVRVLGIDRFAPPHTLGSTHGKTRIIREAYFEHPLYVPLLRRAYELWAQLEAVSERQLFLPTGGLMIGPPEGVVVAGARASAEEHGIAHEMLTASEVRERFPAFELPESMVALLEHRAGILFPEPIVAAFLEQAAARGAELITGETALGWEEDGDGVRVATSNGTRVAGRVVVTAGPWLPTLVPDLPLRLTVERQLFHWFAPARNPEHFRADRCPIALIEYRPDNLFATFPDLGDGVKMGVHHDGEIVEPDHVHRETRPEEDRHVRDLLARYSPDAAGALLDSAVCLYTNTPDHDFLVDFHPDSDRVIVASPCSGHGFKFASVIGEILAELATVGASRFDLAPFRVGRRVGSR